MEGFSRPGSLGGEAHDDDSVEGHIMDEERTQDTDTEGHAKWPRAEDDAEGHVMRRAAEGDDDEAEGHIKFPRAEGDDDEAEGHIKFPRADDDEDTEGHAKVR